MKYSLGSWMALPALLVVSQFASAAVVPPLKDIIGFYNVEQTSQWDYQYRPGYQHPSPDEADAAWIEFVEPVDGKEAVRVSLRSDETGYFMPQFYLLRDAEGRLFTSPNLPTLPNFKSKKAQIKLADINSDGEYVFKARKDVRFHLSFTEDGKIHLSRFVPKFCWALYYPKFETARCVAFGKWDSDPIRYEFSRPVPDEDSQY